MKTISVLLLGVAALLSQAHAENTPMNNTKTDSSKVEQAVFGGGCFWCMEAVFEKLDGVVSVESGYAGGAVADPSYEQVCTGRTGHAEVIRITFDPARISYEKLLSVFWHAHDPTTLNRQGADSGTQYRSTILYANEGQKETATRSKAAAAKIFQDPVVTEIVPLKAFYKAEDYHQAYYKLNGHAPYCQIVIAPKLRKLEQEKIIP